MLRRGCRGKARLLQSRGEPPTLVGRMGKLLLIAAMVLPLGWQRPILVTSNKVAFGHL